MKTIRILLIIIVATFMFALIIFPDRYISSVSYGLQLFAMSVLPALFPFFFFSKILTSLDVAASMGKALKNPLRKCFHSPPVAGYIFIVSLLSGYPVGAKLLADCYNSGIISAKQAKNISVFTSTSGPLFILGTVGITMLTSKLAGFIILFSHYLGAIVNGFLLTSKTNDYEDKKLLKNTIPYDTLLSDSITSSIISVAIVGGYIAIFSMLVDVLVDFKIISFFSSILTFFKLPHALAYGIVISFVEITRGCLSLSKSGNLMIAVPIIAGMISFGGLSITLQSLTFSAKCKIKPLFYLKTKLSQGIITYFVASVLCVLLL